MIEHISADKLVFTSLLLLIQLTFFTTDHSLKTMERELTAVLCNQLV